ncbi:MAG: hypothetical protein ACRDSR_10005 [Pseudonocardiaceae bacterium]
MRITMTKRRVLEAASGKFLDEVKAAASGSTDWPTPIRTPRQRDKSLTENGRRFGRAIGEDTAIAESTFNTIVR